MAKPVFSTGDVPTASQFNDWLVNILFARKTADETVTSTTTLQDDDHLFVSVAANAVYHAIIVVREVSQTAAAFKCGFTGPAGYSFAGNALGEGVSAASLGDVLSVEAVSGTNMAFGGIPGNNLPLTIQGLVITAGTAGTFRFQWAQNTSNAGGTTVKANSFMLLRQVA